VSRLHSGDWDWKVSSAQGYLALVTQWLPTASQSHGSGHMADPLKPEKERGTPVHDRLRTRYEPGDAVRVEDVIPADILNDTRVDREYLEQVFREPQKFLPPRVKPEPEPEPEQPPLEQESLLARRAKLAALLAAGALVAGAIVAASTLAGQHRAQTPTRAADTLEITGAAALGGFTAPDPPPSSQGRAKPTKPSSKQTPAALTAETTQASGQITTIASTTATPSPTTSSGPRTTVADRLVAVSNFYSLVNHDPQSALGMLKPLLAGQEPGDLVRAWDSIKGVQVEDTRVQPDGSILATVTIVQLDGSRLRVTQLLRFAEDASGLISDARLLSTQRM
jgi:hypothetical protein